MCTKTVVYGQMFYKSAVVVVTSSVNILKNIVKPVSLISTVTQVSARKAIGKTTEGPQVPDLGQTSLIAGAEVLGTPEAILGAQLYNGEWYRDWETDRKSTRLNSSHRSLSRMPSSA